MRMVSLVSFVDGVGVEDGVEMEMAIVGCWWGLGLCLS